MCFAPQRRAFFRHLNFQKWCAPGVFCTFWLRHVLRATTACNLSSLIWPAGSAPAALASLLFDRSSGASNHWKKHSVSRLSYLFAHLHLLSSDSFSSTLLSSNLSLLSASALLCFSSVHIVGSLTSKLPSIIYHIRIYMLAWISENAGRPFADVEGQGDLSGPGPVKKSLTFNLKASHLGALGVFIFEPCCTQLESNLSQPTAVLHRVNPIYSQAFKDMYWLQLEDRTFIYIYIVRIHSTSVRPVEAVAIHHTSLITLHSIVYVSYKVVPHS